MSTYSKIYASCITYVIVYINLKNLSVCCDLWMIAAHQETLEAEIDKCKPMYWH